MHPFKRNTEPWARMICSPSKTGQLTAGTQDRPTEVHLGAPQSTWMTSMPGATKGQDCRAPQTGAMEPRGHAGSAGSGHLAGTAPPSSWSQLPEEDLGHFEEGAPKRKGKGGRRTWDPLGRRSKGNSTLSPHCFFRSIFSKDQITVALAD